MIWLSAKTIWPSAKLILAISQPSTASGQTARLSAQTMQSMAISQFSTAISHFSTAISPHDAKHGHQPSRGNATPKGSALQLQTGTGTIVMVQFRDGTLATEDMCLARNVACTAISPNDARPLQDRYHTLPSVHTSPDVHTLPSVHLNPHITPVLYCRTQLQNRRLLKDCFILRRNQLRLNFSVDFLNRSFDFERVFLSRVGLGGGIATRHSNPRFFFLFFSTSFFRHANTRSSTRRI